MKLSPPRPTFSPDVPHDPTTYHTVGRLLQLYQKGPPELLPIVFLDTFEHVRLGDMMAHRTRFASYCSSTSNPPLLPALLFSLFKNDSHQDVVECPSLHFSLRYPRRPCPPPDLLPGLRSLSDFYVRPLPPIATCYLCFGFHLFLIRVGWCLFAHARPCFSSSALRLSPRTSDWFRLTRIPDIQTDKPPPCPTQRKLSEYRP